jgi:DNA (cytosine-5)-methyltransferase 1
MEDPRNHLFKAYVDILKEINPDGFIFENVTGLLNMNGGSVFQAVKEAFAEVMPHIEAQVLCAHEYGIPQRRKRVILAGVRKAGDFEWPTPFTAASVDGTLFGPRAPWISVQEALSDLPPLLPGEDGSQKEYLAGKLTDYQKFCRGILQPSEYLTSVRQRA